MSDRRIEDLGDSLAVPRKNGELVFEAPWEGRVFGMTVALSDGEVYPWNDFRDRLVAEITAAEEHGDDSGYYERWLASFERLLLDSGVVTADELDARTAEYAAGVQVSVGRAVGARPVANLIRIAHITRSGVAHGARRLHGVGRAVVGGAVADVGNVAGAG